MDKSRTFQIEQFYYGSFIQNGQTVGSPTVLAASAGIKNEQLQEVLRLARLSPPTADQTSEEYPSAIGLFRGESVEYIFLKAQRTASGFPQLHYWLLPALLLRWLGGNYQLLTQVGQREMPIFAEKQVLETITLDNPQPLDDSEQVEYLYDLFYYCGDKIKNVEGLITALIHSQSIAILNAPTSLKKRMGFVEGLLAMLPAPARVGITWATHVDKVENATAQLKFVTQKTPPPEHVIFDWATSELVSELETDKYSKFIASQLRLDASLVVDATADIAKTAIWRAMRKDSLPQALYVASRRATVDSAVRSNQPAERDLVAAILRQDPTLSDELRVMYAEHLLKFTLVLDDQPEHADVLPVAAAANRPVAEAVYEQLQYAAVGERPLKVIEIIHRWMQLIPQAASIPWYQLAHKAALQHLDNLLDGGKIADAVGFMVQLQRLDDAMRFGEIVPQLIEHAQPYAAQNKDLASAIFLLAATHLSADGFQATLSNPQLVAQLPRSVQQAIYHLQPEPKPDHPPGVLVTAASGLTPEQAMLVVSKLAEWAIRLDRTNLIDHRTMEHILKTVKIGKGDRFEALIRYLTSEFIQPEKLKSLDMAALEMLPQLCFATQRYAIGVRLLENYQFTIFTLDRLPAFADHIGKIFLQVKLPPEEFKKIFDLIEKSKLRQEARLRAYCAVLINSEWNKAYQEVAQRITGILYSDPKLTKIIGIENTIRLLDFHVDTNAIISIMQTGSVISDLALISGERGVDLVVRLWEHLHNHPEAANAGIELLRRYVRKADHNIAENLPDHYGRILSDKIGSQLLATYTMRLIMGDQDLTELNTAIEFTTNLLMDVAIPYHSDKEHPPMHRIRQNLDSMSGGLSDQERDTLGADFELIAKMVFTIGKQRPMNKETSELRSALLDHEIAPHHAWDMLMFLSGRFAENKRYPFDLTRQGVSHILGNRSAVVLREEIPIIARFLGNLLRAFPPDNEPTLMVAALDEELDSLWNTVSLYNKREIQPRLAENCQHLTQVIQVLTKDVRERIFSNNALFEGRQKPTAGLEAIRWISGYFSRAHKQE